MLGPHGCTSCSLGRGALPREVCGSYSLGAVLGLLVAEASLVEHGLQGLWAPALVACGLSSCVSQALEHRLSSCGAWAWLVPDRWVLSRSGIEPISPALARGFFTTEPPGKPRAELLLYVFLFNCNNYLNGSDNNIHNSKNSPPPI